MNTDNTETVAAFDHDGASYEIDHLGITHPDQRGEYAIYRDGQQVGEFLAWGTYLRPEAQPTDLPSEAELIALARQALADA